MLEYSLIDVAVFVFPDGTTQWHRSNEQFIPCEIIDQWKKLNIDKYKDTKVTIGLVNICMLESDFISKIENQISS